MRETTLFADHRQVYVMDALSEGPDPEAITTDSLIQRVHVGGDHLAIFTRRASDVRVRVEVLPEAPEMDHAEWDHVVDGALSLVSGRMVMLGCTDPQDGATALEIAPGPYRLRVSMAGLAPVPPSADAPGEAGRERYCVQLWPGPLRATGVRKMFLDP